MPRAASARSTAAATNRNARSLLVAASAPPADPQAAGREECVRTISAIGSCPDPDIHGFAQERWLGHARIRQLVDEANDVAAGRAPVVPGESGIRATGDTVAVVATDEEEWRSRSSRAFPPVRGPGANQLADRSERIGSIVASIAGLADQTNLLALNAAMEAAPLRRNSGGGYAAERATRRAVASAMVRSFAGPVRWGVEDHARRHAAM